MAQVRVKSELDLDSPTLVEGLPGIGLVGKIATDHLVDTLDMTYVASVDCASIPQVTIYDEGARHVLPPVRIYANESEDVLALQSDVPISRGGGDEFAECITAWLQDNDVTPLYLSGLPRPTTNPGTSPRSSASAPATPSRVSTIWTSAGPRTRHRRRAHGRPHQPRRRVRPRRHRPCRRLRPQFPDPAAAKHLIQDAIEPLSGVDVSTEDLVEHAEDIRDQKEQFAQRMQEANEEESTQAQPMRMFQ